MSLTTTSEMRLVGSGLALLPRVNLLPPEIEERRRFRQVQYGLGAAVVAAAGVVALLVVGANASVGSAQDEVSAAQSRNTVLQAETAKFAEVRAVYARAAAAQATLTLAMGEEVRYSRVLNDMSLSIPKDIWVTKLSYTQTPPPATPAAATAAAGATTAAGLGRLEVEGYGFKHDDVALWLESLAGQKVYGEPDLTASKEELIGQKKVVKFTSTATLVQAALSGRFTKPAGG